ncbi:alpha/beta hydrolase [Actinoplanes sp. HUAS TT8]|uniref:alpha/beta hydrolase n=1 Tax=Actinoplanes sp. HUAS TT8 TaxID=3447453 RepID=UPI003F51EFA8
MTTVLLVHGGLWEEMDAERFWHRPGIVAGLQRHGVGVLAPDRLRRPRSWTAEAQHLAALLPEHPVTVVAGSNGCSAAVRLALAAPERVERLLLAWPATAGDPRVDTRTRLGLAQLGAEPDVLDALLNGGTLRGVTDDELASVAVPVGVLPSVPENPFHQRRTVDALLRLVPTAVALPGCPEPPHPAFPPHTEALVRTVAAFALA